MCALNDFPIHRRCNLRQRRARALSAVVAIGRSHLRGGGGIELSSNKVRFRGGAISGIAPQYFSATNRRFAIEAMSS
jgi:hypothetical protein